MRLVTRLITPLIFLLAMLLPVGGATAAPAESIRIEDALFANNGCNGEFVTLEGTTHIVSKQQKNELIEHVNIHGQGVGDQGNEYVLNQTSKYQSTSGDFSSAERIRVISKGSAPNQVLITHYDPDTGFIFETDCRG